MGQEFPAPEGGPHGSNLAERNLTDEGGHTREPTDGRTGAVLGATPPWPRQIPAAVRAIRAAASGSGSVTARRA